MKIKKHIWFSEKNQHIQQRWYKFFVEKKQVPLDKLIESIKEIQAVNKARNFNCTLRWISDWQFDALITTVTKNTGIQFKQRPTKYNDYYDERNMDGSFAYNGCTNDF